MMLAEINKKKNHGKVNESCGYINGQAKGSIPEMRYGLCSMSFNGCEVIAVYNALVYIGRKIPLEEAAYFMERHKMLAGVFGGNPFSLISHPAFRNTASRRIEKYSEIENADAFIVSFWCGKTFFSGIHTVFGIHRENGSVAIYNRYNSSEKETEYKNFRSFIGKKKIIAAYIISKEMR